MKKASTSSLTCTSHRLWIRPPAYRAHHTWLI